MGRHRAERVAIQSQLAYIPSSERGRPDPLMRSRLPFTTAAYLRRADASVLDGRRAGKNQLPPMRLDSGARGRRSGELFAAAALVPGKEAPVRAIHHGDAH